VHPDGRRVTQIDRQGWIRYDARRVYISYWLGGHEVGLEQTEDGNVRVWFCRMLLGAFVPRRDTTIQPCVDSADTTDTKRVDTQHVDEDRADESLDTPTIDELSAPAG
jgi:hypothetical protein